MVKVEVEPERVALLPQDRQLQEELQQAADQHPDGQRQDRHVELIVQEQGRGDHRQIEKDGGDRRGKEVAQGVENPHAEGDEADKEDVGEEEAIEGDRQLQLAGDGGKAGEEQMDDERGKDNAEEGDAGHDDGQQGEADIGEFAGAGIAVLLPPFRKDRHKGGGERPFGKEAAQQVGDHEGAEEGVGRHPGAEEAGDDHVAHHAEDAREDGGEAEDAGGFDDLLFFGHAVFRSRG